MDESTKDALVGVTVFSIVAGTLYLCVLLSYSVVDDNDRFLQECLSRGYEAEAIIYRNHDLTSASVCCYREGVPIDDSPCLDEETVEELRLLKE